MKIPTGSATALGFAGLLTIAFATTASTAEATRPLVRAASALKEMGIAIPMPLEKALDPKRDLLGLDIEDEPVRTLALKQASAYNDLRRGRLTRVQSQQWTERCESSLGKPDSDFFCRYEMERRSSGNSRASNSRRDDRRAFASELREGKFDKVAALTFAEMISTVRQLEIGGSLEDVAGKALATDSCVPTTVTSALGYKLEERFPQAEAVDLTKRLYKKAASCGRDFAAAQAAFRLSLIHVWQNECGATPELLAKVESVPEASTYHARAKYWRHYCAGVNSNETGAFVGANFVDETESHVVPNSRGRRR